jgi:hypothetical protein
VAQAQEETDRAHHTCTEDTRLFAEFLITFLQQNKVGLVREWFELHNSLETAEFEGNRGILEWNGNGKKIYFLNISHFYKRKLTFNDNKENS